MKQDVRWAACGFLQKYLQDVRKTEFRGRWESYDLVMPSDSIHQTWSLNFAQIELPIIEWFKKQATDLVGGLDVFDQDTSDILEVIRQKYGHLGKDPDTILNDNIKALNSRWRRLWIVLASIALRGLDKDVILTQLQIIDEEAPGKWVMEDDRHQTTLCVAVASEEELFALLCEWINTQAVAVKKQFEGVKANTLDAFIKSNQVTPEEEKMAEENLKKGPIVVPKRTIGRKPLEIPEQDKPLDELRKKLDELLSDNNQEILNKLTEDVNLDICANLGDAPLPRSPRIPRGGRAPGPKEKDKNFIGYVGEYLIYRALKKRYPHISLSNWVSGNKQKFFPGSQGNDNLGYDFCLSVGGHKVLIEVKSHIGDQNYFDLGSTELDAAQEALETGTFYQVWVVRNLEGTVDIDHIPNPMTKENRKHFRFEIGRVYYKKE
ncbi:MAG: DUF3883 domain-containing protein [Proteobacteria bacterium]|nr:DUF3883 domain-containing protein [Pseudomonadota bacterium]